MVNVIYRRVIQYRDLKSNKEGIEILLTQEPNTFIIWKNTIDLEGYNNYVILHNEFDRNTAIEEAVKYELPGE